jgi:hypothetical protein
MHNKTTPTPAVPWIASIPLSRDGTRRTSVIVHPGRATCPPEGLQTVFRFNADGQGGWIAAAQADNGRWGYIDDQGRWRVPPTLESARDYSEDGMARFCQDGRWGYVNLAGDVVIPPSFEDTRPFRDGLCAVKVGDKAWRIIDREGRFTCDQSFHYLSTFGAGGLANAVQWNKSKNQYPEGFVDREGRWVIEPRFQSARAFGELPVTPASLDGDRYGLIDTRGQWVLEPRYPRIEAFNSQGLAYYDEPNAWDNGHGYLDATGRVVIKGERHLSKYMACGMVSSTYNGTDFLRSDGTPLPSPPLVYGSHFRSEGGFAVVRTAVRRGEPGPASWGLLHTDGQVIPVGEPLLEPLTDGDGWLAAEQPDTPLVPFLTRDNQVVWIDKQGAMVWRAGYEGQHATLLDAQGKTLWRSGAQPNTQPPHPFFAPPLTQHLETINSLEGITPLAQTLLAEAEARLHQLAAGETLERESTSDDDEDEDGDEADEDALQAWHTVVTRRVMRTYISEEHNGPYEFLCSELSSTVDQARTAMLQMLSDRYGKPDPDPEHAAPWHRAGGPTQAWAVPLAQALPGDTGVLHESREQWLSLYKSSDSGDGDAWWELWLMVAPSLDALASAQRARNRALLHGGQVGENTEEDGEDEDGNTASPPGEPAKPQTREEWLQAVGSDRYAIAHVPTRWLDDAMVDAALATDVEAMAWVPGPFQTPERLEALIRRGVGEAANIPPQCMTTEGLALARALYAGEQDWDWRDQRNSRLPKKWDHNSLGDVWACLLTPELALKAVRAQAPLRDLAHWLRTDAVEQAALQADIYNISYLDKAKITPELAARAVQHDYGLLIETIPPELLTPALCLASAQANGMSLEKIPAPLRSLPVCVAALKDRGAAFAYVPEALHLAVATQLIEDDLAEARKDGTPREGSHWHGTRAWTRLWAGDYEGAIADAQLGRPHMRYEQHAHYVMASAYRALGRTHEAALEASTVLSIDSTYSAAWDENEDTRWLQALVQSQAGAADDAALVAQLQSHPRTLADIPRERITHAMVDVALAADEDTVRFVPRRLMTPARYATALRQGVKEFKQIPPDMLGEEACIVWVCDGGWHLEQVPLALRTLTVCAYAVRRSSSAMEYVPEALRSEIPEAIKRLPPEEDDDDNGSGSDWLARKLVDSVMGAEATTTAGRLQQKGIYMAFALKTMLGAKTGDAPTLKGLAGWFEVRPFLAMVTNAVLALAALVAHVLVSVGAWRAEGFWAGLGTFVLMGLSDLYWAWRFVFSTPYSPGLGVACGVVLVYLFAWRGLYRRVGLVYAAQAEAKQQT